MKRMCPPGYHHNSFVATVPKCMSCINRTSTVHHVPKCISCHKVIVVITGKAHCIYELLNFKFYFRVLLFKNYSTYTNTHTNTHYIYIYIYMNVREGRSKLYII